MPTTATHPLTHFVYLLAALIAGAAFLMTAPAPARADTAPAAETAPTPTPRLVTPGDMTSGALLFKAKEKGRYIQAPALATDVDIDVTGPIARTRVTQRFENPSDGWVEGIYVFPLPEKAAIDTLRMMIGNRVIEGQIKERQEARQIYERAREAGQRASLMEQERPNVFTNSVANIGPGETIVVQIEYQETVRQDEGIFSLRFPMVVAPRYNPMPRIHMVDFQTGPQGGGGQDGWGHVSDPVPDRDRIEPPVLHPKLGKTNPVSLTVSLDAGFPLGDIKSPHHQIRIAPNGERRATLTLAEGEVPADKDFELTWTPAAGNTPTAALFRERVEGEDYLLVMVTPPYGDTAPESRPREAIFVIDNSGSMAGQSMPQAKASLLLALDGLKPNDRFNVIRFDNTMEQLFPAPVPADAGHIAEARRFVERLEADGGTEMLPALKAALQDATPRDKTHVRQIIFLTDGAIGNEDQLFAEIAAHLGRSRLFTVGIGSAPNSFFMRRAAELGRGTFTHIGEEAQVAEQMKVLFEKLEHPVMTDLKAVWPNGMVTEAWPNPLPDLYKGEPVLLSARTSVATGTLNIVGTLKGQPWEVRLPLDAAEDRPGVGKLWARNKIAALEAERYANHEADPDKEILAVSLEHHLVSRLTSLVAVDVTPARPHGEPLSQRDVPLNLPEGWVFDKVFGEQPVPPQRDAAKRAALPMLAMAVSAAPEAEASAQDMATAGIALPQGATDAPRLIQTGLLSLLLGLSLLMSWRLWHHLGAAIARSGRGR